MTGINLTSSFTEKGRRKKSIIDSSFFMITLLFLATVGGFFGERYYLKTLETTLGNLQSILMESSAQLSGDRIDRVANIENRITLLTEQKNDRIDFQPFWQSLERLVVQKVILTQYEYKVIDKKITITGTTDSLMSVAQQIVSFKSDVLLAGITVASIERDEDSGQFIFSFIVNL